MLRFYICFAVNFMVLFMSFGFALVALGSTQPIHPALRGFVEGCEVIEQPCWYGIVPGVTTEAEVETILSANNFSWSSDSNAYASRCSTYIDTVLVRICFPFSFQPASTDVVASVGVTLGSGVIKLGDVMILFGEPRGYGGVSGSFGSANLIYREHLMISFVDVQSRLNDYVLAVNLFSDSSDIYVLFHWRGFASQWRYCELEPNDYSCQ